MSLAVDRADCPQQLHEYKAHGGMGFGWGAMSAWRAGLSNSRLMNVPRDDIRKQHALKCATAHWPVAPNMMGLVLSRESRSHSLFRTALVKITVSFPGIPQKRGLAPEGLERGDTRKKAQG